MGIVFTIDSANDPVVNRDFHTTFRRGNIHTTFVVIPSNLSVREGADFFNICTVPLNGFHDDRFLPVLVVPGQIEDLPVYLVEVIRFRWSDPRLCHVELDTMLAGLVALLDHRRPDVRTELECIFPLVFTLPACENKLDLFHVRADNAFGPDIHAMAVRTLRSKGHVSLLS